MLKVQLIAAAVIVVFATRTASGQIVLDVPSQYPTVQSAINAAGYGDKVRVAPGTYVGYVSLGSVPIILEGAGPGLCTLQGTGSGPVIGGTGQNRNTVIRGFRITGGTWSGMYFDISSPTIENCLVEQNSTPFYGGGIEASESGPLIIDCVIRNNTAALGGGGIGMSGGALLGCRIENNTAPIGAGIHAYGDGDVWIIDCTVAGNVGVSSAVELEGADTRLENSTIANNTGAIRDMNPYWYSPIEMLNCVVWGNQPSTPIGFDPRYSDVEGLASGAGVGVISLDPLFINPLGGDFRLGAGSPCRDAGDPASAPDADGSFVDMGDLVDHLHLGGGAIGDVGIAPVGSYGNFNQLRVDGDAGDLGRRVHRSTGQTFSVSLTDPPFAASASPIAVAFHAGVPATSEATFLASIGEIVFTPDPSLTTIVVDGFGGTGIAGPAFSPWSISVSLPMPMTGVLQALYWRNNSYAQLRTTNAVLLQVF